MAIGGKKTFIEVRVGGSDQKPDTYLYFLNAAKIDKTDITVVSLTEEFQSSYLQSVAAGEIPLVPMEHLGQFIHDTLDDIARQDGQVAPLRRANQAVQAENDFAALAMAGLSVLIHAGALGGAPNDGKHYGFGLTRGGTACVPVRIESNVGPHKPIPPSLVRAAFRREALAKKGR